jgi:2-haloacid dehalogenase
MPRVTQGRRDTVIFDLGAVLVDWDPRYVYRELFPDDETGMEAFLAEVTTSAWNHQMDGGKPWAEAIEELIALHPEQRELIETYRRRWPEMLGGEIEGTVAVLADLRATGVRLFALTNWSAETFPVARERFAWLGWFEGVVVSGEERLTKPDPALYRVLVDRYGVDPAGAVFIDDRTENVAAAESLGMTGIRFTSPEALRLELEALGLVARHG